MNSAMVSLNRFWISSMLPMFAICSSSRIFSRRAFSSGVRFFLAIFKTSCAVLLFYTIQEVYTNLRIVSQDLFLFQRSGGAWLDRRGRQHHGAPAAGHRISVWRV